MSNVEYLDRRRHASPSQGPARRVHRRRRRARPTTPSSPSARRGPTIDGRVKPDLVGPDGTASSIYGPAQTVASAGSSARPRRRPTWPARPPSCSTPSPDLGPTDVQGILEQRATPAGAAGKDSIWGWGRLALGAANAPTAPTGNLFTGLSPSARLLDTRTANNPLGGGSTARSRSRAPNGVPADATAVVLSLVAIKPTAAGYLTAFPSGAASARRVEPQLRPGPGHLQQRDGRPRLERRLQPVQLLGHHARRRRHRRLVRTHRDQRPRHRGSDPRRRHPAQARPPASRCPGGDIGGTEVLTASSPATRSIPEVPPAPSRSS